MGILNCRARGRLDIGQVGHEKEKTFIEKEIDRETPIYHVTCGYGQMRAFTFYHHFFWPSFSRGSTQFEGLDLTTGDGFRLYHPFSLKFEIQMNQC